MTGINADGSIFIDEFLNENSGLADSAAAAAKQVVIYINEADGDYDLYIGLRKPILTTILEQSYKNARMLSADLVCEIGLGPAVALLEENSIPRTHPIWDLNHSDLWVR